MALTLLDFGALQDRQVLTQCLELFAGAKITNNDPTEAANIEKFQHRARGVDERLAALQKLRPDSQGPAVF